MSGREHGRRTVLVTDAGRGSSLSIIRAIGRRGWRVIAADSDPESLGFASRYAAQHVRYPDPSADPHGCVAALLGAAVEHGVELLIPVTDAVLVPLSEERARFEGVCKLALPSPEALDVVRDKQKTLELAERLGVPTPRTRLVRTAHEASAQVADLGWPVVLKPQASLVQREGEPSEAFKVRYARGPAELEERMREFEGRCPVLLQEYHRGTGCGVELLLHEGTPLAAFQHRRLREIPVSGGASAFRESVPLDAELYDYACRLLRAVRWTGLAMVEFKQGDRGARLMEINGRVWGSLPLAVHSGMDFPGRLADLLLAGPPATTAVATSYATGVRARDLERDLSWILQVLGGRRREPFLPFPARREAVAAVLQLFNPACKYDILSLEDPRPGLRELVRTFNTLRRKVKEVDNRDIPTGGAGGAPRVGEPDLLPPPHGSRARSGGSS